MQGCRTLYLAENVGIDRCYFTGSLAAIFIQCGAIIYNMTKYFEDHVVGETGVVNGYHVDRDEVLAFARAFARPIEAEEGETIKTSAAHIFALYQRMQIDLSFANGSAEAIIAGSGLDQLRWLKPVRAGDELTLEWEVLEKIPSKTKADRGIIRSSYRILNQDSEVVMTLTSDILVRRVDGLRDTISAPGRTLAPQPERLLRRVVTGLSPEGRSAVIFDGPSEKVIWSTDRSPADNRGAADAGGGSLSLANPKNATTFFYTDLAPASSGSSIGLHITDTLDYAVVVTGEITLVTQNGETTLCAGDVVVDRGVLHTWRNDTSELCRLLFVFIKAESIN